MCRVGCGLGQGLQMGILRKWDWPEHTKHKRKIGKKTLLKLRQASGKVLGSVSKSKMTREGLYSEGET